MKEEKDKKIKRLAIFSVIISVIGLTIAFLAMSKVIVIKRNNVIKDARWNIHFDNLKSKAYGDAKIIKYPSLQNNKTYIGDFEIGLTKPGDKVTFTYDIVNSGTIKAKYDRTYVNGIEETNSNNKKILKSIYVESDWDGDGITSEEEIEKSSKNIVIKDKVFKGVLNMNEVHTGNLEINFKGNEIPKGKIELNINLKYDYIQK